MDLTYSADQIAFRNEVRQFIETRLPDDVRRKVALGRRVGKEDMLRWQRILFEQGWGAPNWPTRFGGTGWSVIEQHIFDEERARLCAPKQNYFATKLLAPVLQTFGNAMQQDYYLPRILRGEDFWCQGYSEPGAGSDLASLRTSAVREGDHYIVNGQKTWNTHGHFANWIFCLVRTSSEGRPQQGISFLLVDMSSPGVSVRPILMLDGEHEINDIFFENVRVPLENLVGQENKGWTYAKFLLNHERTGNAGIGACKRALTQLREIATAQPSGRGGCLLDDPRFRDRVAQLELELMALEITNLRVLSEYQKEGKPLGPEVSMLKIKGSEIIQGLAELMMHALGHDAIPLIPEALDFDWPGEPALDRHYGAYAPALSGQYFNLRKNSIYGGSNEIQRNIISQSILGL